MGNDIGFSFEPGAQSIGVGGNVRSVGGPQSAVQIKSFTIPNRFVPGQIAPQALLQSPGGQGGLDVDILRRLMQAFAPQGQQPSTPQLNHTQGAPNPNGGPSLSGQSLGSLYGGIFGAPAPTQAPSQPQTPTLNVGGPPRFVPGDTPDPVNTQGPPAPPINEPAVSYQSAHDRMREKAREGQGLFD